jgi:C-terminal processing protease CtpA/Prc
MEWHLNKALLCILLFLPLVSWSGEDDSKRFEAALGFELGGGSGKPPGWSGKPMETLHLDDQVVHGGKWSTRIERSSESPGAFSALSKTLPIDFSGRFIALRGFLRTEAVTGMAGLWLREDGEGGVLQFDNMSQKNIRGTTEWTEYEINLPLAPNARKLHFGALATGNGKVWVDDLELLVDGKPVTEAPRIERETTVHETDTEFALGSGVEIENLSPLQTENLVNLCKVWGFLKYHHPRITAGELNWDFELFRILPRLLEAGDRPSANARMLEWAMALGEPVDSGASLSEGLHLLPDLDWIHDRDTLGDGLCGYLETVHENRSTSTNQYYVSLQPGVDNPDFSNEKAYRDLSRPDAGYRILAVFRYWNIIRYWFPYRDVIGEDWNRVLAEFLPRIVAADAPDDYKLEFLALIARVNDTHANLWGSLEVRPPRGNGQLPVRVRFVEEKAVITGFLHAEKGPASGLEIGDIIVSLDGEKVDSLVEAWSPYYAASNGPTRYRDIGRSLTTGDEGVCRVGIERAGQSLEIEARRYPIKELDLRTGVYHDLPGDTFRLLSDDVAYLKISSAESIKAEEYVERARETKGFIIDLRNYPSDSMVFSLGQHLVREETPFARFTAGDLSNPGAFRWTEPLSLRPKPPYYEGKVVILVDEISQSSAEYTSMAYRARPGAVVIGSTTAGADGNATHIHLPGKLHTIISGIGVFYPDKAPTQRIGIVPDIEVKPTIVGIREGRDEVLEEALRAVLGTRVPEDEIRRMGRGGG